ncbi:MAG: ferritin [Acholeplasmataceae bacterium]|nr:ferritin [Acholeplasmataceae bacterium]
MNQYHEPLELLSEETKDITRAIRSLIEEFEAVDWYNQRVNATKDVELREILVHNRDEELEHAAMTLEYLRRHLPVLDKELRDNLFKEGPIVGHHGAEE